MVDGRWLCGGDGGKIQRLRVVRLCVGGRLLSEHVILLHGWSQTPTKSAMRADFGGKYAIE
jgi:hypothetical protein